MESTANNKATYYTQLYTIRLNAFLAAILFRSFKKHRY